MLMPNHRPNAVVANAAHTPRRQLVRAFIVSLSATTARALKNRQRMLDEVTELAKARIDAAARQSERRLGQYTK
jgi:hypothetical protein